MHREDIFTFIVIFVVHQATCSCYFPVEIQGEFMTQSLVDQEIAYSTVSILYNSIPGWGVCHSRHGVRIVLQDKTVNGDTCFKCLRLAAKSRNVIQIHSRDIYQCFSSEQDSLLSCPSVSEVAGRKVTEMMLYKTRGFYGESAVSEVICPINGKWRFTYTSGGDEDSSCASPASRAEGCQHGDKFELQFRGCTFPDKEMHFKCMGSWRGEDGQKYAALMDTKLPQLGEVARARYRCVIYKEDLARGFAWMALSNDSTCTHQLHSHSAGYETLQLHSMKQPHRVSRSYSLPKWSQGEWESVSIKGGNLIYKSDEDLTSYSTTTISSPLADRYLVRLETSCGHAAYSCLALERRSDNIIELMLGKQGKSSDQKLCHQDSFSDKQWLTLGKAREPSSCPLVGEFSGALPDAEGLCARSVTSCGRSDRMNYQVYNCENTTEVFEDRSYHCYGGFEEAGLVYTVVKRLDLPYRECFVGVTLDSGILKITEAGTSCGRNKQPGTSGMFLSYRSDQCVEWQWEERISDPVSLVAKNEKSLKPDMKHTSYNTEEVSMELSTQASLSKQDILEKDIKTNQDHIGYEKGEGGIENLNKNVIKVNTFSDSNSFSCSLVILVLPVITLIS